VPSIPLVNIIILNWNNWQDSIACIKSCQKLNWPNFRITLVDNGSTDGSEAYFRSHLPDIEIIQTHTNLGFAGGNNAGIRYALKYGADYFWLINNDAVADPKALTMLVEAMEKNPGVGIAGSKIFYYDEPLKIWSVGGMWQKGRLHWRQRGANKLDKGQFNEQFEVGSISGCSMLVRSSAIQTIGLMEESYFLYWEDTEWCARALEGGYLVWHKISVTTRQGSFSQYYYFVRNGFFFLRRYDPGLIPVFGLYNVLYGLKSIFTGNAHPLWGFLYGCIDFILGKKGPIMMDKE
jgi:GT2 family glycosyltransferase